MSADRPQQVAEARHWLRVVDRDLGAARLCLEGSPGEPEAAAYHCQQAAEKTVKGLLVAAGVPFPKTHNLDVLADLAARHYPELRSDFDACRGLTAWGTAYRYPSLEDAAWTPPGWCKLEKTLESLRQFRDSFAGVLARD